MLKEIDTWQVIKLFQGQLPSLTSQSHERLPKPQEWQVLVPLSGQIMVTSMAQQADTNEEWASYGIHWDKWDFTAIQTPSSADSQARDTCPDTVRHSPHWMSNQQSEHKAHSFSHLYIFIQDLRSWHVSVFILTFKPLWHSTSKIHSLRLISTGIHKVRALCLVSVL